MPEQVYGGHHLHTPVFVLIIERSQMLNYINYIKISLILASSYFYMLWITHIEVVSGYFHQFVTGGVQSFKDHGVCTFAV